MKLEWSVLALEDRDRIYGYIEQDDPQAALKIDERIGKQAKRLITFPQSGRPGRVKGTHGLYQIPVSKTHEGVSQDS